MVAPKTNQLLLSSIEIELQLLLIPKGLSTDKNLPIIGIEAQLFDSFLSVCDREITNIATLVKIEHLASAIFCTAKKVHRCLQRVILILKCKLDSLY